MQNEVGGDAGVVAFLVSGYPFLWMETVLIKEL